MKKIKLYSYVVDHDDGFAPNPFHEYCTLVHCMFSKSTRRNLVEMVKADYNSNYEVWVTGTGGASPFSSGNGTIVYLMKVNYAVPLLDYYSDIEYQSKSYIENGKEIEQLGDRNYPVHTNIFKRYALISKEFFYFGKNAIKIDNPEIKDCLEKKGSRYRKDFDETFITLFLDWIKQKIHSEFGNNSFGLYGFPVTMSEEDVRLSKRCIDELCA